MNKNNQPMGDNNQPKMPRFNMNWIYLLVIVTLGILFFTGGGNSIAEGAGAGTKKEATYTKFKYYVEKNYAKKVVVNKSDGVLRMYVRPEHIRDIFNQSAQQTGKDPYVRLQLREQAQQRFLRCAHQHCPHPVLLLPDVHHIQSHWRRNGWCRRHVQRG